MNFKDYYEANLNETPIDTFKTLSKDKKGNVSDDPEKFASTNSSFSKHDDISKKILTSDNGVKKIKNQFKNTEINFDMYFLNSKEGVKHKEIGEVDYDFVKKELGVEIPVNPENITIIFTNNKGDEKVMMTGWILAHRFGHAVSRKGKSKQAYEEMIGECAESFNNIFIECYNLSPSPLSRNGIPAYGQNYQRSEAIVKAFYAKIGTFKSARENNLRGFYEFYHELFAQYLITGNVKFNDIPKHLPYHFDKSKYWLTASDDEMVEHGSMYLRDLAEYTYPSRANNVLYAAQGKIFVM
jgi:hypothetical protein